MPRCFAFALAVVCVGLGGAQGQACDVTKSSTTRCPSESPTGEPTSVLDYARRDVAAALATAGNTASVRVVTIDDPSAAPALAAANVTLDARPESFAIVASSGDTVVIGRDEVGAMYGAFEVAERVRLDGASALPPAQPIARAPSVPIRGYNTYIAIPDDGESCWYFRDASYWKQYVDEIAHARINFLDLHAMYNNDNTNSPNPLLYFANSASFPAGVIPAAEREKNLAMLVRIVEMARVRGVRVGFLAARSDMDPRADDPGATKVAPLANADEMKLYTREAAKDLATRVPHLWRLGVRVGEGGVPPPDANGQRPLSAQVAWYGATYAPAVAEAHTAHFYTRTWLVPKENMLSLFATPGTDDGVLEVKLGMEQLGPPYVQQPGVFDDQHGGPRGFIPSYLYEDYLEGQAPYSFVFHIWLSASYRLFRYASYERTRRTIDFLTTFSPRVRGFTVQAANAYERQRDFTHANDEDRLSPWTFPHDELEAMLFGRLGYDPTTPERVFRQALRTRTGTDGLWDAMQAGTDVVGWMVSSHACGPDSRDFAPQLEWIGTTGYFSKPATVAADFGTETSCGLQRYHGPLDPFAVAGPYDAAQDLVNRRATTRLSPLDVARVILDDVAKLRAAASVPIDPGNPWARDVQRECAALADLGTHFARKLRAGTALAVYAATGSSDFLAVAKTESGGAVDGWTQLVADTGYIKPFFDPYRTHELPFHWRNDLPKVQTDPQSIQAIVDAVTMSPPVFTGTLPAAAVWLDAPRAPGPGLESLAISPLDPNAPTFHVMVTFKQAVPSAAVVSILYKRFDTHADWATIPTTGGGVGFAADVASVGPGALFAVELSLPPDANGVATGWRYPDALTQTPYVTVAPQ